MPSPLIIDNGKERKLCDFADSNWQTPSFVIGKGNKKQDQVTIPDINTLPSNGPVRHTTTLKKRRQKAALLEKNVESSHNLNLVDWPEKEDSPSHYAFEGDNMHFSMAVS